jgi:CYTH domain-containing protein
MDKTPHLVIRRVFLVEGLPEPLTPASRHLQFFDNYIPNTRMRIRNIRVPETKEWTHILQQVFHVEGDPGALRRTEMHLNESEYGFFERFEGREIRKNRYFHEFDGREFVFDVYLGHLWGLTAAKVEFRSRDEAADFEPPPFVVFEVTGDEFFLESNLVGKKFEDVRAKLNGLEHSLPAPMRGEQE